MQLFTSLLNFTLPTSCLLCRTTLSDELLCAGCQLDLPHLYRAEYRCHQCALPLDAPGSYCGQCLKQPPAFICAVIPFRYAWPLDGLIYHFKEKHHLPSGRGLAQQLAAFVADWYANEELALPDLLIPVPLHWTRRWLRGFNQTEILGREITRRLGIPMNTRLCRRAVRRQPQKHLGRRARQTNLLQAFRLRRESRSVLAGKTVALLDDVVTTTATARALSRLLCEAGAAQVHLWALARTPAPATQKAARQPLPGARHTGG